MPQFAGDRRADGLEDSRAGQDYLKAIYMLQQETGRATTLALAVRLGVKPASVTAMVKRLAEDPGGAFLKHTPYHGVSLTDRGKAVALEMVRHHRLIELFLYEHLGMPWDEVHSEADRLEHVISERLEELIAAKLGHPLLDPHGDPIPALDLTIDMPDDVPLSSMGEGASGVISRVPDGDPATLQYLRRLRLAPGTRVRMQSVEPVGDVYSIRVGRAVHALGGSLARRIKVTLPGAG